MRWQGCRRECREWRWRVGGRPLSAGRGQGLMAAVQQWCLLGRQVRVPEVVCPFKLGPLPMLPGGSGSIGDGGSVVVSSGSSTHGSSGSVTLVTSSADQASGALRLATGDGHTLSGSVEVVAGDADRGLAGPVIVTAGSSSTGTAGAVTLSAGGVSDPSVTAGSAHILAGEGASRGGSVHKYLVALRARALVAPLPCLRALVQLRPAS